MTPVASDVCLIVEGGYPYILGGVASWLDALIRASPALDFHVISISIESQARTRKFQLPGNVVGLTNVILDRCPLGRTPRRNEAADILHGVRLMQSVLVGDAGYPLHNLIDFLKETNFGQTALLDSRPSWIAMEEAYRTLLPNGPLIDFFWSWRFLARSLLAILATSLPDARVFHAVSTGYAGLLGAYARHLTQRPYVVTEHGIYTNERRIELSTANWLFESKASGFTIGDKSVQLRDFWLGAFTSLSRCAYSLADVITTQYSANQEYQRSDGAPAQKLRIIPNGIDVDRYAQVRRNTEPRPPTVLMIGRIVPIKDTRTLIAAMSLVKELVPGVIAFVIGPEEEDPSYASGCRALVDQLGLQSTIQFLGRVPDVTEYIGRADVLVLTSISEAQPIALLEAAASGLPAVTTDVGSCREIIEGFAGDPVIGRGGIVVEACNPKATAEALATILLNDEMRADMGRVMQRRVRELYHKDRITRLYEDLYAQLASQPSVGTARLGEATPLSHEPRTGKVLQFWSRRRRLVGPIGMNDIEDRGSPDYPQVNKHWTN